MTTLDSSEVFKLLGRLTSRRVIWALCLLVGVGWGVRCYLEQRLEGDIVTGTRTVGSGGAGWGLYITFVVFFIGVSFAGVVVASLIRLLSLDALKPLARMAELLTIVALLVGACTVLADLGQPLHGLINLPRYARPTSPFFGTFTMVIGGYLFASLVFFFLSCRSDAAFMAQNARRFRWVYRLWASGFSDTIPEQARHYRSSFWLSLFILPLLITAHSTLGFVFGIQGGRPGWFGSLQAPSFVVAAGLSGIGVLIVVAAAIRWVYRLETVLTVDVFRWLGNFLWVLIVVTLYFVVAEELTASYASGAKERELAHELVGGHYQPLFLLELGSLAIALALLFGQFAVRRTSVSLTVVAGLLVNVGAVLKRYLLVVPSQTHGMLLPYPSGHYAPSPVELGVVGGLTCLAALMYSMFVWVFPIVPLAHASPPVAPPPFELRRVLATVATFVAGLVLATVGFVVSSRIGRAPYLDPALPFSPVIFITGLMLIFGSAAVYEVVPASRRAVQGS